MTFNSMKQYISTGLRMAKLQIDGIPDPIKARIVAIAAKEFGGSVALYLRSAIYKDLLHRQVITKMEEDLLNSFR